MVLRHCVEKQRSGDFKQILYFPFQLCDSLLIRWLCCELDRSNHSQHVALHASECPDSEKVKHTLTHTKHPNKFLTIKEGKYTKTTHTKNAGLG